MGVLCSNPIKDMVHFQIKESKLVYDDEEGFSLS